MAVLLSAAALLGIDFLRGPSLELIPVDTLILKLILAIVFVWSAYTLMARRAPTPVNSVQAGNVFRQAATYIFMSMVFLLVICQILPISFTAQNAPADTPSLFLAYGLGILALLIFLRQLFWFDNLLRLRRTRYTNHYRVILFFGPLLLVVSDVYAALSGPFAFSPHMIVYTLLTVVLLVAVRRVTWLNAFSKADKYKGFFVSIGIVLFSTVLNGFEILDSSDAILGKSAHLILPGMENIMYFSILLSTVYFVRIGFSLLLALPTAGIIDRKIREVQSLSALGRRITQVSDSRQLMDAVTTMVQDVCGATSAWIELLDDDGVPQVATKKRISERDLGLLYQKDVMRKLLYADGQGAYIENLGERPEVQEIYPAIMKFARSLIAVPLTIENRNVGMLLVLHREEFAFEPEDVSLVMAYADTVSIAIENARLFQSSLEKERYKSELLVARDMQQKLLPKHLPTLKYFDIAAYSSPAFEVGGDYYDFVYLADGKPCVVIGDVSGKGISAAFYMAEVKGIVSALAEECRSPGELLQKVNGAIMGHIDKASFITMSAMAFDADTRSMLIARAGHTPVLLCRNGHISRLTPRGLGIGLVQPSMFNSVMEEIEVEISEGDKIVLYTDGVNEAQDEHNNEFGFEALEHIVQHSKSENAEFLLGEIVRKVVEHAGEISQNDDITIVTVLCNSGMEHDEALGKGSSVEYA